jgi:uncharacterized repeat protein (TIGR02543 family)
MRELAMLLIFSTLGACETMGEDSISSNRESALSSNGVNSTLELQSDWGAGYCAEVTLQNTSAAAVTSWTAVVELNQSNLSQIWNGTAVLSGSRMTVSPAGSTASVPAGATVAAFGFCGNSTGPNHRPSLVALSVAGGSSGGGASSYTLAISTSGSGSTSPAAGTYTYASGSTVRVTATPASGATFTGWSGAATGTANSVTITMNGNKSLTANFSGTQVQRYALTIAVSGNGSTSPVAGSYTYASGSTVRVTATPASGATFTGWSGAATGIANPATITLSENKSLTANFSGGGSGLPGSCTGACNAATPVYPTLQSDGGLGNVTMYSTSASSGGACNYGATNVLYYAAMSVNVQPGDGKGQWQGGRVCGQCAEVTALTSRGPKSVVVRIMDKCPDAYCGIDLGGSAPAKIMLDGSGRYQGQWKFVSCSGHPEVSDGAPSLAVVSGSNPWWSRVRVRNPATAVEAIEWKSATASGSFPFATDPENAFEVPVNEVLQSRSASLQITVRYADGTSAAVQLTPAQLGAGNSSYALK